MEMIAKQLKIKTVQEFNGGALPKLAIGADTVAMVPTGFGCVGATLKDQSG